MQKVKEVLSKLWNGYRNWLGDVVWYKNWKVWLSVVVILMLGALGDSDEPEVEAEDNEPKIEEVVEKEEPETEEVEEEEPEEEANMEKPSEELEEETEEEPVEIEDPVVTFDPNDYNAEVTYDDLARNPDDHFFEAVTFEGKIIQVMQGDESWQYRIATNDNYDKVMLIEIDSELLETRILEDDYIRFYGTYMGEITYESALGGNITIPGVLVKHFEFK